MNYMEKTKYGRFRFWKLEIYPYLMVNIFDVFYSFKSLDPLVHTKLMVQLIAIMNDYEKI